MLGLASSRLASGRQGKASANLEVSKLQHVFMCVVEGGNWLVAAEQTGRVWVGACGVTSRTFVWHRPMATNAVSRGVNRSKSWTACRASQPLPFSSFTMAFRTTSSAGPTIGSCAWGASRDTKGDDTPNGDDTEEVWENGLCTRHAVDGSKLPRSISPSLSP